MADPIDGTLLTSLLDSLPIRLAIVDDDGVMVAATRAWMTVDSPDLNSEVLVYPGDNVIEVWSAVTGPGGARARATAVALQRVLATGEPEHELTPIGLGPDEDAHWFRSRIEPMAGGGAVLVHVDVTEEVNIRQVLARRVTHDDVTGLPNAYLVSDRIDLALKGALHQRLAVLVIDIDEFKTVNDSLGRDAGDEVLRTLATRFDELLSEDEWVGRFTGDDFVVVVEDHAHERLALRLASKLAQAAVEPISIGDRTVVVTVSVGIALSGRVPATADGLLRDAEEAGDRAGRGGIALADSLAQSRAVERLEISQALRYAIDHDEFHLAYQPEVAFDDLRVVGAEALLRWQRPDGRELSPDEFVAIAEETGLIVPIGAWVLREACRAASHWPVIDGVGLFVAVNVSARQLVDPLLIGLVDDALAASGLDPSRLCIELTETAVVDRIDESAAVLAALRARGVLVALDDFGTGFSSLSYLAKLPIDIVKLDRSFVSRIDSDPVSAAVVEAVVGLARRLGLKVVAEGVESEAQREELRRLGCDVGQGFTFSRPVTSADVIDLVQRIS